MHDRIEERHEASHSDREAVDSRFLEAMHDRLDLGLPGEEDEDAPLGQLPVNAADLPASDDSGVEGNGAVVSGQKWARV